MTVRAKGDVVTPFRRKRVPHEENQKSLCAQQMDLEAVIPSDYAELRLLVWNRNPTTPITGIDALAIYERQWRFVAIDKLDDTEKALIQALTKKYGNGHFTPLK